MTPFACGDVVRRRGGATLMTVEAVLVWNCIQCVWFEGDTLERGLFSPADLESGAL